jgi:RNA-directed DNA polymerase
VRRLIRVPERPLPNLEHLASAVGVNAEFLTEVAERRIDPYREFKILKASGHSTRTIAAPLPDLAKAQRWILDYMFGGSDPGLGSFAYHRGVSVKDCAEVHMGARWLVKLDLRDFFNSIDERRVAKIFRMTKTEEETSVALAKLCTRVPLPRRLSGNQALGYLPQGAPISGMLANLAAHNLDLSLSRLAWNQDLRYTRYSDDITFSSPSVFSRAKADRVIRSARDHIARNNFVMNEKKTRICPPGSRLAVMGLLVDSERVRLSPDFKKRLKWHVYGSKRFGVVQYSASKGFSDVEKYLLHVDGLFAHAMHVEPEWTQPLEQDWYASRASIKAENFTAVKL